MNEHTGLERKAFEDPHVLQIRPDLTLEPGTTYTYRLHGLTDRGQDVVPQERLPILLGPDILNEDGSINVPGLSAAQATALSTLQSALRPYISQWQSDGIDPLSLSALGTFTTLSASDILVSHREELQAQTLDLNFDNTELKTPFNRGLLLLWPDVETVYSGEATIWSWIEPNTRRRVAEPVPVKTEFVLTLPEEPEDQGNVPVVLFGHGINTSAELVYGVANFLAEAGYASFAPSCSITKAALIEQGPPSKKPPRLVSPSPPYMLFLYYSYRGVWETMAGNIVNVTNGIKHV